MVNEGCFEEVARMVRQCWKDKLGEQDESQGLESGREYGRAVGRCKIRLGLEGQGRSPGLLFLLRVLGWAAGSLLGVGFSSIVSTKTKGFKSSTTC